MSRWKKLLFFIIGFLFILPICYTTLLFRTSELNWEYLNPTAILVIVSSSVLFLPLVFLSKYFWALVILVILDFIFIAKGPDRNWPYIVCGVGNGIIYYSLVWILFNGKL